MPGAVTDAPTGALTGAHLVWLQQVSHGGDTAPELAAALALAARHLAPQALARRMAVASILAGLRLDTQALAAALLDGVALEPARLRREAGAPVLALLQGLEQVQGLEQLTAQRAAQEPAQPEALRRMLLAMAQDVRVVLIFLARQLAALRDAAHLTPSGQQALARQTQEMHAPLANRLGVWQLKWELEDLAFRILEPGVHADLTRRLAGTQAVREVRITRAAARLRQALAAAGIEGAVSGRPKHLYSIWRKMQRKRVSLEHIFDVQALRVLVDSVKDCYAALGVVHGLWPHIPREFDDYIAKPKPNGYQSLHTAVEGEDGLPLEVQIRTRDMHRHAELGVAAHWRYKEGAATPQAADEASRWARQILEQPDAAGGGDFVDRFRDEVFAGRIYALTPQGRILDLPAGATALDFAYHVHSSVGHRCRGARINGRLLPIGTPLHNGETVEIITAHEGGPSRDWLHPAQPVAVTARARGHIRHWFRQREHETHVAAGKALLDKELQRAGLKLAAEPLLAALRLEKLEDLHAALGNGALTPAAVLAQLAPPAPRRPPPPRPPPVAAIATLPPGMAPRVRVPGIGAALTRLARCCAPAPPAPITGFVTRGQGVTVHRQDCAQLRRLAPAQRARLLDVHWEDYTAPAPKPKPARGRVARRPGT